MARLGDLVQKVRSKNAGPFWLTVDIFCATAEAFAAVSEGLSTAAIGDLLKTPPEVIKRFDIADLRVVKFSLPRPQVQGTIHDRDMHGAAAATLFLNLEI